jgi:hypothetical protein
MNRLGFTLFPHPAENVGTDDLIPCFLNEDIKREGARVLVPVQIALRGSSKPMQLWVNARLTSNNKSDSPARHQTLHCPCTLGEFLAKYPSLPLWRFLHCVTRATHLLGLFSGDIGNEHGQCQANFATLVGSSNEEYLPPSSPHPQGSRVPFEQALFLRR